MRQRVLLAFGTVLAVVALAAPAKAATIDFAGAYNGIGTTTLTAGVLDGQNIDIRMVFGVNTPGNPGVLLPITNGLLDFNSASGLFRIRGSITGGGFVGYTGDSFGGACGVALLCGVLQGFTVDDTAYRLYGTSQIAEALAAFYGLGGLPFVFNDDVHYDGSSAFSADIPNTPIPEPGSMLLLGSGLIALAGSARRRFAKK